MRTLSRVDVHLRPGEREAELRAGVLTGLTASPKRLQPKWNYDERGSALFEEITRLPEYYLTRRESEILRDRAGQIASTSGAETLVELGAGTSEKTRLLIDALSEAGTLRCFVPFDVSAETLRASSETLAAEYPELMVHGVVGDFERDLGRLPRDGRRLLVFLGSTIGNLDPSRRRAFLASVAATLKTGESFLLGADLVKDVARLEAAYNDSEGVTPKFSRNILRVLNAELGANFDPELFEHVATFDPVEEWIDIRLRSLSDQTVTVRELDLSVHFARGEELRTEISAKFRRERLEAELRAAGLAPTRWWTDAAGDFGVSLSTRL